MNKLFSLLLCLALGGTLTFADEIKVTPSEVTKDHEKRSPIIIPSVYIDGYTLSFDASCIGGTLSLEQDGVVVYTATIVETDDWEGEVVLPDYLVGTYTLSIVLPNGCENYGTFDIEY